MRQPARGCDGSQALWSRLPSEAQQRRRPRLPRQGPWSQRPPRAPEHRVVGGNHERRLQRRKKPLLASAGIFVAAVLGQVAGQGRLECHEKCTKCHLFDYSLEWHCLECEPGYELWVDGCIAPCPARQYRYGYDCFDCPANCEKCVGPLRHECKKCDPGFELDARSVCMKSCQDGAFPSLDGLRCPDCNPYCKTCLDAYEISCTSCFEGYYLRVLNERTQSGQCMMTCPLGFYRDAPTDVRCLACSKSCANCTSADLCFKCEEGSSLHRGYCYVNASMSEREAINFENFLESGAGIQWDQDQAPQWQDLFRSDL